MNDLYVVAYVEGTRARVLGGAFHPQIALNLIIRSFERSQWMARLDLEVFKSPGADIQQAADVDLYVAFAEGYRAVATATDHTGGVSHQYYDLFKVQVSSPEVR